ncbi:DNA-directed DNA polymerase epsilon, subunit B [Varicellaria rhodocarpa]|nr:DNA-directed DNA polymerase epsilon, subunit B [Varicellaria rhodocarpa]
MNGQSTTIPGEAAAIFRSAALSTSKDQVPSSSPAFGTPVHPILSTVPLKPTILPILLPPATLRPVAFRTFTKKHSLTLTSVTLQALATFIGKHCGSGWREEGLAEKVLEEIAKAWKKDGGSVIVDANGDQFKKILRNLESCMSGGRVISQGGLSRQASYSSIWNSKGEPKSRISDHPNGISREDSQSSLGASALDLKENEDDDQEEDLRKWIKVIGAFEQPRLVYNTNKKHFERSNTSPSLLADPSHKTLLFRHRYNLVYQRLLQNESFQAPTIAPTRTASLKRSSSNLATPQEAYKITPIANLLGRNGSKHLLLGLIMISPTGMTALSDLTGSIPLDLRHAVSVPENGAWFTPGMIVLVDGFYEEQGLIVGSALGGGGGVGGTIGGKFIALTMGGPPCERREITLGVGGPSGELYASGRFGWVDFLGVGSEKVSGATMRRRERQIMNCQPAQSTSAFKRPIVMLGEINLDNPKTIQALKKVLGAYATREAEEVPILFILIGNFVQYAVMAGGGSGGSIEYKEFFNSLASVLSDYPSILRTSKFVFVPGDNDPWASSFSAGAATVLPRKAIPELLTSRIKKAFSAANAEAEKDSGTKANGEAVWTTNPTRISIFGPVHEIVIFRDDISGRFRRTALMFQSRKQQEKSPEPTELAEDVLPILHDEYEPMEVDEAVKAAESHVPDPKSRDYKGSLLSPEQITARKLVKTVLDQGHLSPFPFSHRPVLWDFAGALQLYPMPSALVLMDPEAPPFALTYEGCHVMNPGRLVAEGRKGLAQWIEYDVASRRSKAQNILF